MHVALCICAALIVANNPCACNSRYSHTSLVIGDTLYLIGGISLLHRPLGVTAIDLTSGKSLEYSLNVSTIFLLPSPAVPFHMQLGCVIFSDAGQQDCHVT